MADRFWVGGSGYWDDTDRWSLLSGQTGAPYCPASVPTATDNAYFDENSFTADNQTVIIDNANAECLDMDWTGATSVYTGITLIGEPGYDLNVYGNLILAAGMSTYGYATSHLCFKATASKHITTNGVVIRWDTVFDSSTGIWSLLDDFTMYSDSGLDFSLTSGSFYTNDHNITAPHCINIDSDGVFHAGSSVLSTGKLIVTGTFDADTSTINMTAAYQDQLSADGCTLNIVRIQGNITLVGDMTIDTLIIDAGKTLTLTAGTAQVITSLTANGSTENLITIQSSSAGNAATISKASGTATVSYCSIKDIAATGGATFEAIDSVDVSGNTGWEFIVGGRFLSMMKIW
jgi:hypothetical protein